MNKTTMMVPIIVAVLLSGCEVLQIASPSVAGSPKLPPDYDLQESQFVAGNFSKLASEFLDEYAGQYVVFDGRYMNHTQGALIWSGGHPFKATNMMSATIGGPTLMSRGGVTVIWSMDDRELGRPFLDLQINAPVKIYAYVLPANRPALMKSRRDRQFMAPAPTILLIKAAPLPK